MNVRENAILAVLIIEMEREMNKIEISCRGGGSNRENVKAKKTAGKCRQSEITAASGAQFNEASKCIFFLSFR